MKTTDDRFDRKDKSAPFLIGTDRYGASDFDNLFLMALTREASKRNWKLVALEYFQGKLLEGMKLDGIFTRSPRDSDRFRQLEKISTRFIRIGTAPNPDDHLLPAVLPDLHAQGRLAVQHFVERGFQHIAFVGLPPWGVWQNTFHGVEKAANEARVTSHLFKMPHESVTGTAAAERNRIAFSQWISKTPRPLALVCSHDTLAVSAIVWSNFLGLKVPEEVAILGNGGDTHLCFRCWPRLSSVLPREYQRGFVACDLMEKLLSGGKAPKKPVMIEPSHISIRESTDILASDDPVLTKALLYMWANIDQDLSVENVASHVGLHRRKLERSFRAAFGRGVNAELKRRRLEKSRRLLFWTDETVRDIAVKTGFRSEEYFYRSFRRAFGATPLQLRREHQST